MTLTPIGNLYLSLRYPKKAPIMTSGKEPANHMKNSASIYEPAHEHEHAT